MQTTPYNLAGFIDEILQVLRGLPGENYIPDQPVNSPAIYPFGTVYSATGITKAQPAGQVQTDLNDVTIAWIVPLDDLSKASAFMLPFREQIPMHLIDEFIVNKRSNHVQHPFREIQISLGPVDWSGGAVMFGYLITLIGSKIQNEVSI